MMIVLVIGVMGMGAMCMSSCSAAYMTWENGMLCEWAPDLQLGCPTLTTTGPPTTTTTTTTTDTPAPTDCTAQARTKCADKKGKEREKCISTEKKACTGLGTYCSNTYADFGRFTETDSAGGALSVAYDIDTNKTKMAILQRENNNCNYGTEDNDNGDGHNRTVTTLHKLVSLGGNKFKIQPRLGGETRYLQAQACTTDAAVGYGDGKSRATWMLQRPSGATDCGRYIFKNTSCNKYLAVGANWGEKNNAWKLKLASKDHAKEWWMETRNCVGD